MPSIAAFDLLVALVAIAAAAYFRKYFTKSPGLPYPPGPRGLPLVGNIYDMPKNLTPQEAYLNMSRKYDSDIVHLKMLNSHLIIVNSQEAANELFDRRSALYSDRPIQPMVTDLVQLNWFSALMRYGDTWRSHRRIHHKYFHPKDTTDFEKKQLKSIHELLRRVVHQPDDLFAHVRLMMGSLLLSITYGIDPKTVEHPFIFMAETTIGVAATAGTPGAFLVDVFPWLKYVPAWAPGAGFITKAMRWRKIVNDCAEEPYNYIKDLVRQDAAPPSVAATAIQALEDGKDNSAQEEILKGVTAMVYAAGADTTISVINTIILALLLNPDAQMKAHAEISRLIGKANRLPDYGDFESLPYCIAIVREALRWRPTAPLAIPHRLMSDDVYNGMFFPAGSTVIGNAWGMLQDERVWPEPKRFRPERFLTPWGELDRSVKNTEDIAFGFGRRHCPGRPIAISVLYAVTASIIATLEIVPSLDGKGKPIIPDPDLEFTPGLVSSPIPFKCEFKPRSQHSLDLINEAILSEAS